MGAPELRRVLRAEFDLELDLWLLTHRDLRRTARIRAVLDFLTAAVHQDEALLTG
jgi:DNA-binding transcriptional LysR family regulator